MYDFCIIGAGTYGSYLANALSKKFPKASIALVEVGDEKIKNEDEIGFRSEVKGSYKATKLGRYFGLGGTSSRWGGQILFFSERDFQSPGEMGPVVEANLIYKKKVLSRFFSTIPEVTDYQIDESIFLRDGIWLKMNQRNLFDSLNIKALSNLSLVKNCRVQKILFDNDEVTGVEVCGKGEEVRLLKANRYFLTAGAFESMLILDNSGLVNLENATRGFGDHLSIRCFEIFEPPNMFDHDFTFKVENGSLLTKRIVGEIDGVSFFAHPIFNTEFVIFQFLKDLIFKKKLDWKMAVKSLPQILHFFPFLFQYFVRKKVYVHKSWFLQIDFESASAQSYVRRSSVVDDHGGFGIEVGYFKNDKFGTYINNVIDSIKQRLDEQNLNYVALDNNVETLKAEDTYHPYNLYNGTDMSFDQIVSPLANLNVYHTGILKRAGGINPTGSIFCLIEKHVDELSLTR